MRMSAWPADVHRVLLPAVLRGSARAPARSCRRSTAIISYCAGMRVEAACASPRAAVFDSVQRIASNFSRSNSVNSSSFLPRNAVAPAYMRLLSAVSMWKTFMCRSTSAPMRSTLRVQLRPLRIHVAVRVADRLRLVVRAQALVVAQADRDRLVAAVHRHEVDVDVDDQVALGAAPVDVHRLAVVGLAEVHDAVRILGVVVVVAVGVVRVEDLAARPCASSRRSVSCRCSELAMMMCTSSTPLASSSSSTISRIVCRMSGVRHRRQRQADVVDGDGHLHAGRELRVQRIASPAGGSARSGWRRPGWRSPSIGGFG